MKKLVIVSGNLVFSVEGTDYDPIDEFLDEIENTVQLWTAKINSDTISDNDILEFKLLEIKFNEKAVEWKKEKEFSPDQLRRYSDIRVKLKRIQINEKN